MPPSRRACGDGGASGKGGAAPARSQQREWRSAPTERATVDLRGWEEGRSVRAPATPQQSGSDLDARQQDGDEQDPSTVADAPVSKLGAIEGW